MFTLLKKLFVNQPEPEIQEIELQNLDTWLQDQAKTTNFTNYIQEYLRQLEEIKAKLKEKTQFLIVEDIDRKKYKNIEARVENVVLGHKNNYVAALERFIENLPSPKKTDYQTLEDFQEMLNFNQDFNKKLDQLAKETAKSHQATEHLFFDSVDQLLKLLKELNALAKKFEQEVELKNVRTFLETKETIFLLQQEIVRQAQLKEEIKNMGNELSNQKKELQQLQQNLTSLDQSKAHQQLTNLQEQKLLLDQQYKDIEYQIFSFFSKLNKPLKKYERIALDSKQIQKYVENGTKAFWQNEELEIVSILASLKKNLQENKIEFPENQKNNFLALIERSESGYLQELKNSGKDLQQKQEELQIKIDENTIIKEMEELELNISHQKHKIEMTEKDISAFNHKLELSNLNEQKEEIISWAKSALNKDLRITSS